MLFRFIIFTIRRRFTFAVAGTAIAAVIAIRILFINVHAFTGLHLLG